MTHMDPLAWKESWDALVVLRPGWSECMSQGWRSGPLWGLPPSLAENLLESGLS